MGSVSVLASVSVLGTCCCLARPYSTYHVVSKNLPLIPRLSVAYWYPKTCPSLRRQRGVAVYPRFRGAPGIDLDPGCSSGVGLTSAERCPLQRLHMVLGRG
ncbi:hypothetical protein F4821DRAFT_228700 [Hypoxylon rubiginosum]|uniref:Uncharacterized protein n=1 Tax=Hypoxylon rubiginosum TaxID=110542 RepID=A0ACC0DDB8_9PEZI|nr:hypothetical protein F4821DRAFT_228700 [Hypoxylon rubiginosum]